MRVAGLTERGELRIVDDNDQTVAYADLHIRDAYYLTTDDWWPLEAKITWVRESSG